MLIDFHAHLHDYGNDDYHADAVYQEARRIGIDYVCISEPLLHTYRWDCERVTYQNDLVFRAYNRYPDFYIPLVYTQANMGDFAMDEVKKGFDRGAVGVKMEIATLVDEKCVEPIIEFCIDHDCILVQHTWHKINGNYPFESDAYHCVEVAKRFPELKLVVAHIGGDYRWGMRTIRDYPSLYTDCSGSICDYGAIEQVVAMIGPERLLWGTDARGADYLYTLGKVRESHLSDEDKAKILGENAAKLLKITP